MNKTIKINGQEISVLMFFSELGMDSDIGSSTETEKPKYVLDYFEVKTAHTELPNIDLGLMVKKYIEDNFESLTDEYRAGE